MKYKFFLFPLVLVAMAGFMLSCSNDQEPERPNIIFIMADDHAYQAMSCYDGSLNSTPNIDRIANEGMLFMNSYVTNSICAPSRPVLLIGKWHLKSEPQSFDYWNVLTGQITEKLKKKLYELKVDYGDTPELEDLHMPFKK